MCGIACTRQHRTQPFLQLQSLCGADLVTPAHGEQWNALPVRQQMQRQLLLQEATAGT